MRNHEFNRCLRIIREAINTLELDLKGLKVLTEAGSGFYSLLPIISAMANAEETMAWTSDSEYGPGSEIIKNSLAIASKLGLDDRIDYYNGLVNTDHLSSADIITNSRFLRPLGAEKLRHCSTNVVIAMMYENWELRGGDIDIDYCNKNGIRICGINESHFKIKVFQQTGNLAAKMAMEAGYELYGNRIIIWSDDNFGPVISRTFKNLGAKEVFVTTDFNIVLQNIHKIDFIFLADYSENREYFNENFFDLNRLVRINPSFGIIHLYGKIDFRKVSELGLNISPSRNGFEQVMSNTFSYLGPAPVIYLQVAGLKAGEMMLKGETGRLIQPFNY